MECKYHELYTPIYTKRTTITTGDHEPTDAEAEWPSDSEDEDEGLSEEVTHQIELALLNVTFPLFILSMCSFLRSKKRQSWTRQTKTKT